ncbi:MAG: GNAT family N-acetyltransferase [Planctomycetota bacterium]|nr:GNAT family N-acetyltransferase [Planctomycetota bacterium]
MSEPLSVPPLCRLLQTADLRAAQRLRELAHWNQTDQDWLNLLAMEPQGCFAAEVNGVAIGTATTTRFLPASGPGSFGWVGMVLVHPDFRGHGIGSTLLRRAIDYLRACGVETVKLDATPLGRPVYLKHGFLDECSLERWQGMAGPMQAPSRATRPLAASDLASVIAYSGRASSSNKPASPSSERSCVCTKAPTPPPASARELPPSRAPRSAEA